MQGFSIQRMLGITIQPPKNVHPPGIKELIRTIWSLIRPNRVLIFLGMGTFGSCTCLTPKYVNYPPYVALRTPTEG